MGGLPNGAGRYMGENKVLYKGTWDENKIVGYGQVCFKKGDWYPVKMIDGQMVRQS